MTGDTGHLKEGNRNYIYYFLLELVPGAGVGFPAGFNG
jgi:hypothetical protein